jgi:hypothetical protein
VIPYYIHSVTVTSGNFEGGGQGGPWATSYEPQFGSTSAVTATARLKPPSDLICGGAGEVTSQLTSDVATKDDKKGQ